MLFYVELLGFCTMFYLSIATGVKFYKIVHPLARPLASLMFGQAMVACGMLVFSIALHYDLWYMFSVTNQTILRMLMFLVLSVISLIVYYSVNTLEK